MTSDIVRHYEGEETAKDYHRIRPGYPDFIRSAILEYMLGQSTGPHRGKRFGKMLDVGCGGGKSTHMFASHFDSVLGIDISAAQIKVAKETNANENVEFQLVHNNRLPVNDETVDLVTCATSAHFLDIEIFVKECERILRPGGCVALYWYHPAGIVLRSDPKKRVSKEELTKYGVTCAKRCGGDPYQIALFEKEYVQLYDAIENKSKSWAEIPHQEIRWTLGDVKGLYSSVGVYRMRMAKQNEQDPLDLLMKDIKGALRVPDDKKDDEVEVDFIFEYPTIVFSKHRVV